MNFIDEIIQNIVRPIREQYRVNRLGPNEFFVPSAVGGTDLQVHRADDAILNASGLKIHLSCYEIRNRSPHLPYVVYLHANNGCRIEGLSYLKALLENQMNVVLFDCSGSGISEGDYVSLGVRESEDLEAVVNYLCDRRQAPNICLWGRSMGAVTALIYASRNRRQIKCCVYDSPFRSLKKLIKQLASNRTGLPQFIFKPLIPIINNRLKEKYGWNFEDLKIKNCVEGIQVPGMFIASKSDTMVSCQHSEKLYRLYAGAKQIEYIASSHHENRPEQIIKKAILFMKSCVQKATQAQSMRRLHSIFNMSSSSFINSPKGTSMAESLILGSATSKNGKVSIANLKNLMNTEASMTMSSQQTARNMTPVSHNSRIKENSHQSNFAYGIAPNAQTQSSGNFGTGTGNFFKKKMEDSVRVDYPNGGQLLTESLSARTNMESFKNKLVVRQFFSKPAQHQQQLHPKGIKLFSKQQS